MISKFVLLLLVFCNVDVDDDDIFVVVVDIFNRLFRRDDNPLPIILRFGSMTVDDEIAVAVVGDDIDVDDDDNDDGDDIDVEFM